MNVHLPLTHSVSRPTVPVLPCSCSLCTGQGFSTFLLRPRQLISAVAWRGTEWGTFITRLHSVACWHGVHHILLSRDLCALMTPGMYG